MTGADWKHPHLVVLIAATIIAFGGGYALGGRRAQPTVGTPPVIDANEVTTAPRPRARPDENALIAENAERDEAANRARPERPEPRGETRPEPPPRVRDTRDDPDREIDPDALDPDRGDVDKPQG